MVKYCTNCEGSLTCYNCCIDNRIPILMCNRCIKTCCEHKFPLDMCDSCINYYYNNNNRHKNDRKEEYICKSCNSCSLVCLKCTTYLNCLVCEKTPLWNLKNNSNLKKNKFFD